MGSTKISSPAAPSATSSMTDYVNNYPRLMELQQQYAPQEAQMNVDLATKYAGQYGQAYLTAQKAMYPEEYALKDTLMTQAQEGMNSQVPQWQQDQYRSDLNANMGTNVGSGIGADYMSRGLQQQQQDWKQYYQNMALSLSGSQPIYQASTPNYTNQLQGYTAGGVAQNNASIFGTMGNIYGTKQQAASAGNPYFNAAAGMGGMVLGGMATGGTGFFK